MKRAITIMAALLLALLPASAQKDTLRVSFWAAAGSRMSSSAAIMVIALFMMRYTF